MVAVVHSLKQGTLSSALVTMSTLASATYIASSAIDLGSDIPEDVTLQVEATPGSTPTGNQQLKVFAQFSLDATNYSTGPTSGTTTTLEPDLHLIGYLPCLTAALHRKMFSLAGLPVARYMKIVVFNDMGVALTSGFVYSAAINGNSN